jgi:penicillin-binding protein 1A
MRAAPGQKGVVLEAFKPGQAPPVNDLVAGTDTIDGTQQGISPDADRAVMRSGTGGLY